MLSLSTQSVHYKRFTAPVEYPFDPNGHKTWPPVPTFATVERPLITRPCYHPRRDLKKITDPRYHGFTVHGESSWCHIGRAFAEEALKFEITTNASMHTFARSCLCIVGIFPLDRSISVMCTRKAAT